MCGCFAGPKHFKKINHCFIISIFLIVSKIIVLESNNVYEVCKENQVKSNTDPTLSSPSECLMASVGYEQKSAGCTGLKSFVAGWT